MAELDKTALIAILTISMWPGKICDLRVKNKVANQYSANPASGTYIKLLLPEDEAFRNVQRKEREIRATIKANTLPWDDNGARILSTRNFSDFGDMARRLKREWHETVEQFTLGYEASKKQAQRKMGKLYRESEYPPKQQVRERFNLELTLQPVPSDDLRVGIPDEDLRNLRSEMTARLARMTKVAMHKLWKQLYSYARRSLNMRKAHLGLDRERLDQFARMNFAEDEDFDRMIGRLRIWPKGKDAGDLLEHLRMEAEENGISHA